MISAHSSVVEQIRRFDRFYETILRKAVRAAASEDFSAADVRVEAYGLVASAASPNDARMRTWDLTPLGRQFAERIEDEYRERVLRLLLDVLPAEQERLVEAMRVIERALHRAWLWPG